MWILVLLIYTNSPSHSSTNVQISHWHNQPSCVAAGHSLQNTFEPDRKVKFKCLKQS